MCKVRVFKRFKAEERIPYEINMWNTGMLHGILKQARKCSDVIGMFFTLVGNNDTKLIVYKNIPHHFEGVLMFHV
jgi:hypothetical protein